MITKSGRHEAREFSFQFLYHLQISGFEEQKQKLSGKNAASVLETLLSDFIVTVDYKLDESSSHFAQNLILGTLKYHQDLEKTIEQNSHNWQLHRISKVDLSILLQAIYELIYIPETPHRVVINEALEIAKKFGSADSKNFVNGILDTVAKAQGYE